MFSISSVVSNIIGSVMIDNGGVMAIFLVASGIAVLSTVIMSCKFINLFSELRRKKKRNYVNEAFKKSFFS